MIELLPQPKSQLHLDRYIKLIRYCQETKFADTYLEKHHILPKSMFPEFAKTTENIVSVTARIHFILHYLLWKAYRNSSMWNAFRFMAISTNSQNRYLNSRLYDSLKKEKVQLTTEQKEKISKSTKGIKKMSIESRAKMSAWQKGKPKPSSRRQKTDEEKVKISLSQKGKPRPETTGINSGRSKPIEIKGIKFINYNSCAEYFKISRPTLNKYIKLNYYPDHIFNVYS